jgi:uncharacterized protein (TIGR03435 family)
MGMKHSLLRTAVLAVFTGSALLAQNIVGQWQGTLETSQRPLRLVFKIARNADESLNVQGFSIDQSGQPVVASVAKLDGGTLKLTLPGIGATYEGKLAADGNTINGTFTQNNALPLNLVKATPTTTWAIPDPPPPPRVMAADAKPVFEVATIKPSAPEAQGQGINVNRSGDFTTRNTPLFELIKFSYGVHGKQVVNGPAWTESERFDIMAKADTPGMPNAAQLKSAVQKLLTERFGLAFHREKRELSAYVITVDKAGVKMTKSQNNGVPLPGFGGRGPGAIGVRNATMAEFADFLQSRVLERPVVDQSGLTDRYDFTLEWKPDPSQLGPNAPAQLPQNIEDRPDLMTAIRMQLGLKIESTKAPVEVLVIDKVTKPTEN